MAKIFLRYKIENAQPKYVPGMNITGKVWVESQETKEKKLKNVAARVMEYYEVYETRKSGKTRTTAWWPEGKVLKKFPIAQKEILPSGATLEFPFSIDLPEWKPKHEKNHRNWWMAVFFVQKTGLMASGGAAPLDACFLLPVEGTTAPTSIIQGIIGGHSRSAVEGAGSLATPGIGSGATMDLGYAESLAQQAVTRMETGDSMGTNTIKRLESMFPKNDEIFYRTFVRVGIEQTAQHSQHWNSPVLASRMGMAYLEPAKGGTWRFMFLPWTTVRSVKKAVKFGSSLDQVSGDVTFKKGRRGAFGRIFFKLMREGTETRSDLKQRKKEFRQIFPDLYNSAKRAQLSAEPVEMIFRGAGGVGDPISVSGPPPADTPQATDADLFPGFSQQRTPAPAPAPTQTFDFGSPAPSQSTESFDEEWDDDWFEEPASTPAPAQPAPPATDFLPAQKPKPDDSSSEEWDWDEWED